MFTLFRNTCLNILILSLCIIAMPGEARADDYDSLKEGTVIRVNDGDTITVRHRLEEIRVRLFGIDAPERGQPGGLEAAEFLKDLVLSETVIIRTLYLDQYERDVAIVAFPHGELLQDILLKAGHAWVYPTFCTIPRCAEWERLENQAREKALGLWAEDGAVAPWAWGVQ